jgi:hypothetical protein
MIFSRIDLSRVSISVVTVERTYSSGTPCGTIWISVSETY